MQYGGVAFKPSAVKEIVAIDAPRVSVKTEKQEKGSSLKETLRLLRSGLKPEEVGKKRGLAASTIEGHLAQLIKLGELDIHECMTEDRLQVIITGVREADAANLSSIRQKVGEEFSFGEIRAVVNHLHFQESKNATTS